MAFITYRGLVQILSPDPDPGFSGSVTYQNNMKSLADAIHTLQNAPSGGTQDLSSVLAEGNTTTNTATFGGLSIVATGDSGLALNGSNLVMNDGSGIGGNSIAMDGGSILFSGLDGSYDFPGSVAAGSTDRGGNGGVSLFCNAGYELNWQNGVLNIDGPASAGKINFTTGGFIQDNTSGGINLYGLIAVETAGFSSEIQQWSGPYPSAYKLLLRNDSPGAGFAHYHFDIVNDGTTYTDTLVLDRNVVTAKVFQATTVSVSEAITLAPQGSNPSSPTEGMMYVDNVHALKIYLDGAWKTVTVS